MKNRMEGIEESERLMSRGEERSMRERKEKG